MYEITIQRQVKSDALPSPARFRRWALAVLKAHVFAAEITIRITDAIEMAELNQKWRHKKGPTNVLSFPLEVPKKGEKSPLIGDIVICLEVILREAAEQHKTPETHFAHMVVHGILHLIGFDHENTSDAETMEAEEIHILKTLGFKNPYQ
ncbi:MAG: rRNA maturation RNase YbeY [Gammaproteobacteria bacterium]|nr:rRNA maturation RNase YbeY [Gammaproteobacteria bacterium]